MSQDNFYICRNTLNKLGIDPQEAIRYLECKNAVDMNPAHVKALHILRKRPKIASSNS